MSVRVRAKRPFAKSLSPVMRADFAISIPLSCPDCRRKPIVIPAKPGIQTCSAAGALDSRIRGNDTLYLCRRYPVRVGRSQILIAELLADDALVERMPGIEQED